MRQIKCKITLTVISVILLMITAVSSTYAWLSLNDSAKLEPFEVKIENTSQLLVSVDGEHFKPLLTEEDILTAVNLYSDSPISSLKEIRLMPVTSNDGIHFRKEEIRFVGGKRQLSSAEADANSKIGMKLYFTIRTGTTDTRYPEYDLQFKSEDSDGVGKTSFSGTPQEIRLQNELTTKDRSMKAKETITVNPVNALRMQVTTETEKYIYCPTDETDLGSYAFDEEILTQLGQIDSEYNQEKYQSGKNAMFTYYNRINNNLLKPKFYQSATSLEDTKNLIDSLRDSLEGSLGTFHYSETEKKYNVLEVDLSLWIEGFDADNLIGLNTTSVRIALSFEMKQRE